ncbi:MFS transporter [Paraburkholderia susongensis]|uniref:Predicted arabinose efflux permease, MFS family n=1 Tax=Paraburkholderia susongensis TaxID=1515439 RepID=A0A1X7LHC2_9BURK|nr:MFS transporter [Paraburkholderia susongensis]SMG53251.1 Predicted arabinose efflux permease, MFS family [Paraburkholderia susongensis]
METQPKGQATAGTVVRVVSGNFLEMYDFMVYGFYASAIAKAMFPGNNEFVSLMLSLATFGMGFLMRPLGAIVLGSYMDRHGRRAGLLLTLALMSIGVLLIAVTPTYASIGVLAPTLVIFGRLLQGFSAGAESGGVSVYLSEIAPPGRRGFFVSWQSASQQLSVLLAAVLGVALRFTLTDEQMNTWGWRIPFLLGCSIVPVLFWIRRSVRESHAFEMRKRQTVGEIFSSLAQSWRTIFWAMMLVSLTSIMFYLITAYTPTFGRVELGLKPIDTFYVTTCVALVTFTMIPVMAAVSDRIGRRPLLIGSSLTIALVSYPAMTWLVAAPSFTSLLLVEMGFAFLYATYQAALVVTLTEIIPANVRGTGFSLAYSLSQAVFGGFTPAICTALIHVTENKAMPGVWLVIGALFALLSTLVIVRGNNRHVESLSTGAVS